MCRFKSGLILKNKVVLAPEGNESHSDLLQDMKIEDNYNNSLRKFVRAELLPPNGNVAASVEKWKFVVDQDVVPEWYEEDPGKYENDFRAAVKDYLKDRFAIIAGRAWNLIKEDGDKKYYLLYGTLGDYSFGNTNDYAKSRIRKLLNESDLLKDLKKVYGKKLVPISTDLTSMDGFDDYGTVEGDFLSIPTFDLYRECSRKIPLIADSYWLATPNQTPPRKDTSCVQFVFLNGLVDYDLCRWGHGVRPFFIVKS